MVNRKNTNCWPGNERRAIVVLSNDVKLTGALSPVLGPEYKLLTALHTDRARQLVSGGLVDAIILDISGGSIYGEEPTAVLDDFVTNGVAVIVMSGDEKRQEALDLVERGAYTYLRTPPAGRELRAALRGAQENRRLKSELETARMQLESATGLDQHIGSSAKMQVTYKLIRKVADLEASVLITGESGTGRELIAQAIHNTGSRSERPFLGVSCGAIPETLIEAELFGHERSAFTGAVSVREGYFEKAGEGTLFLDEIGELNPQTQVKLLRGRQQREFTRLGSSRLIPLRARIACHSPRSESNGRRGCFLPGPPYLPGRLNWAVARPKRSVITSAIRVIGEKWSH